MRASSLFVSAAALTLTAPLAWSVPSSPMPSGGAGGSAGAMSQSPHERALLEYNSGLDEAKKADDLETQALKESDPKQQEKGLRKAHYGYVSARHYFDDATRHEPNMPEAWNELGYAYRKSGDNQAALKAYERALTLRPGYPEALEYRGEAYLGLNRLDDAKQVYLDLFSSNREISAHLLTAMKSWVEQHRKAGGTPDAATVDEFDKWVQERSQITAQTTSLTRAGAAASWN
ncbi:MAG TPA: tetratricopeptide repeat protein [Steroidobacteraceae bacterium]|nr:tetratricopeptide repeat protein [Steroidobacteraceae bacterium]